MTPPADRSEPVTADGSTATHDRLGGLRDELDRLLDLMTGSCPEEPDPADLPPEDVAARHHVLALLDAIHDQHPGAWMPVHTIANYQTDRQNYACVRRAASALVAARQVQDLRVLINQASQMLIRTPTDIDTLDTDQIRAQANLALAPLGYQITVSPARKIIDNFTAVTVTHGGLQYTAYQWTRPYIVEVAGHPSA